jgi:hypothetical protein
MRRDGVPREGPAVFVPAKDDHRTVYRVPLGLCPCGCGQEYGLLVRWPLATSGNPRPIRTDVIDMSQKPTITRPFSRDPYQTLPLEPEVVAEPAEQGAA